jgi:hypothetical protein
VGHRLERLNRHARMISWSIMPRIILGYGDYEGHTLPEVSEETLQGLARRYPLKVGGFDSSDGGSLLITVAIHEEIKRRLDGGEQTKSVPTLKELATKLVASGYRQLSKVHHPDRDGAPEAQRRLNKVREFLVDACDGIADENYDAIIIQEPGPQISDEDIPF